MKKEYVSPQLIVHGDVDEITQTAGTQFTDVPQGTANTGPGSVTGS